MGSETAASPRNNQNVFCSLWFTRSPNHWFTRQNIKTIDRGGHQWLQRGSERVGGGAIALWSIVVSPPARVPLSLSHPLPARS